MTHERFRPTAMQIKGLARAVNYGYRPLDKMPKDLQTDRFIHLMHKHTCAPLHIGQSGVMLTQRVFALFQFKPNSN